MHAQTVSQKQITSKGLDSAGKKRACCPSCEKISTFTPAGVQYIPKHIAAAAGLPEAVNLYHCDHCQSTISDQDLMF